MRRLVVACAIALSASPSALAQDSSTTSREEHGVSLVAFFVPQRVLLESSWGKSAGSTVGALRDRKSAEVTARKKEIEAKQQKSSVLSNEARLAVQRALERDQVDLQRLQQDADAAVQDLQQELTEELDRLLPAVLATVARARGAVVLLRSDTGTLAWADPQLDVTDDVIKRLDEVTVRAGKTPPGR